VKRSLPVALLLLLVTGCAPAAPGTPAAGPTAPQAERAAKPTATAAPPGAPRRGGTLRIGLSQEPIVLNPLLGRQTVGDVVSQNVLEGLTRARPDGGYQPLLAAEIPSQQNGGVSADGLTITWKLKPGLLWSDGQPLTSKDLLFTYQVNMNPDNPIVVRTGYNEIASITAPDDATVVVAYKQLYAAYKGAFPWVLPAHAFNGDTLIDRKDFNRAPLGSGPFKFKAWASGDTIAL